MTSCKTETDLKAREKSILYFPADFAIPIEERSLVNGCSVRLELLPAVIIRDSCFILCGLPESGTLDLARWIIENFFFEIDRYGGFLSANRSHVLALSRPF